MTASFPKEIEPKAPSVAASPFAAWLAASPLTSFVGRETALLAIDESFSGAGRLTTLVGPPGMGKTRLATRYAQTRGGTYRPGGAWFCDLTLARDAADASGAVCATLGIQTTQLRDELGGDELGRAIGRALAARGATLLVLDNFEQLVHAADVVTSWYREAPELRLLVTSRERLRVPGERALELGPLDLPGDSADAAEILETEAARLYSDRARAAGASEPSGGDAKAIGALVRALDGIPLAIELAAARARTLAPSDILQRLTQRFEVLKARDARASRHATLERAIDWSWNLLEPEEQEALAQCSVFAGGFSLEAAEKVVVLGNGHETPLFEVIDALCDKSLVTARPAEQTRRFGMYVSIRDYASAKLGVADGRRATDRHASYYLEQAEVWASAFANRADTKARDALRREQENLVAIYRRTTAPPRTVARDMSAIRAVLALYPALESQGPLDELLAMVDAAVKLAERQEIPPAQLARTLFARGCTYGFRGKVREGISDLERALRVAESVGEEPVMGEALVWLSVRYRHAGRFAEALDACDRAYPILERAGYKRMMGLSLAVRGRLRGELGRAAEARVDNERGMAIFRELGDRWYEGLTLANLGQLDMQAGDLDEARWYYEQALLAFREVKDPRYEGLYLAYLGSLDWETEDLDTARTRLFESIAILERARTLNTAPLFRGVLGGVLAELGDVEGALLELDRADNALVDAGVPAHVAAIHCHRGHLELARAKVAAARNNPKDAQRLRDAARARVSTAKSLTEASVTGAQARLVDCSDDVRFAVRMLERALGPEATGDESGLLDVGTDARWFAVGGNAKVDLTRRGPIRLILLALVESRLARPGVALRQEQLLRAGWPGERVLADAGSKRVRVAVSTLRRLGLEQLLVTRDDGYLLDPRAEVLREEEHR
jgi:predicted ATPase